MSQWSPDTYAEHSSLQETMAARVLATLDLDDSMRVLDVGCGDGKITAGISRRIPRGSVLGVDPSTSMIAHASEVFAPPAYPNLRFEVADARSLPDRGEFDVVVSFNALHWVPEHEEALRSIRNSLRTGGRAHLRFVPEGRRRSLEDVLEDVRELPAWSGHFSGFRRPFSHPTAEEYRALAEEAGFVVDRLRVEDEAWDFGGRDAFVAFGRATFVEWTSRLPEPIRERFIAAVLDRYRSLAADGPRESNVFKFYQMDVTLTAVDGSG
ncbi:MAG TPA: methyltransferase domain-containing protein [Isosphaeraceae bacterium]|jgi:trans-aconitate methyltransferase